MSQQGLQPFGWWSPSTQAPVFDPQSLVGIVQQIRSPLHIVQNGEQGSLGAALQGSTASQKLNQTDGFPWIASLPALYPEWLGDRAFLEAHGARFPYIAGEMARGIASTQMVIAIAQAGMLGFFGTAGLSLERIEQGLGEIKQALGNDSSLWGCNLIHDLNDQAQEAAVVALFLKHQVHRVSSSAFMSLTPQVVHYACSGLHQEADGRIRRSNFLFAKISRPEVAEHFMSPPPQALLDGLVAAGKLSQQEASLARQLPLSEDVTVESDSGGHTDNRPLASLFPAIKNLRDRLVAKYNFPRNIRLGAAGSLGTPEALASAFALGADYVLVASVNQCSQESGLSQEGREMLVKAELADVGMAPCADMFELGVKVQVLKRGSMFASRATQLYEAYTTCSSLEEIPVKQREKLEKQIFRAPLEEIWGRTKTFFEQNNPKEVERAERDPKHRMALVFRWYLGYTSRWPIDGTKDRRLDYQIWCGPAMGAFNSWVAGSFLEPLENRGVVQIALNLLEGAAINTRAQLLRSYGLPIPAAAFHFTPRPLQ